MSFGNGNVNESMEIDEETTIEKRFRYQLKYIIIGRVHQNYKFKFGQLPDGDGDDSDSDTDCDSENSDEMGDNYDNSHRYYRELISRKSENQTSPMWNQFVPSHKENMKYLVSKLKVSEENGDIEVDRIESFSSELYNEVSQFVDPSTINPSSSLTLSDNDIEEPILNCNPLEDVQLQYDLQEDIKEDLKQFQLDWSIADCF